MHEARKIIKLTGLAVVVFLAAILFSTVALRSAFAASAAGDNTTASPKVCELATQLAEE